MASSTELLLTGLGQQGSTVINSTDRFSGDWSLIHCLTDCIFDEYIDDMMDGSLTSITIPQGAVLGGQIKALKLSSGTVIAYQ